MIPSTSFCSRRRSLTLMGGLLASLAVPVAAQQRRGQGLPPEPLTPEEARWVTWMREEEKFARDAYTRLYAKWEVRIFRNIADSEERHFAAVGNLIARYGIADPVAGLAEGAFASPELAALYARLAAKGETSLQDAMEVGILIEKQDIADLETAIQSAAKRDVKTVFANLLAGSLNHLDAFETGLDLVCVGARLEGVSP